MSDDELIEVPRDEPTGERIQESVVGDVAAVTSAVVSTLAYAQQSISTRHRRAEMAAELSELQRQLDIERRWRLVQMHGLEALDAYDGGYVGFGDFDPEPFTGFGLDDY